MGLACVRLLYNPLGPFLVPQPGDTVAQSNQDTLLLQGLLVLVIMMPLAVKNALPFSVSVKLLSTDPNIFAYLCRYDLL